MALSSTNISTTLVANALGSGSRDVGTLCTHPSIVPWSKWKPISSKIQTMTLDELKLRNYGIEIIKANNLDDLISRVNTNGGKGYVYNRPFGGKTSPFRLGDFRNYEKQAVVPVNTVYENNAVVKIGGNTSGSDQKFYEVPIASAESVSSDTTLGSDELYIHYTDPNGHRYNLHRGAIIINKMVGDPIVKVFFSNNFYWWDTDIQKLKGTTARVYECYTNAEGSGSVPYEPHAGDIFLALPNSRYDVYLSSEEPIKPKEAAVICDPRFMMPGVYTDIRYRMTVSSIGEAYTGGDLKHFGVSICTDREGRHILKSDYTFGDIHLGREEEKAFGLKTFHLDNNTNPQLYFITYWNYDIKDVKGVGYDINPNT